MSHDSLPPLPENRIVLAVGTVGVDFLATVASYPDPDDKIRTTSLKVANDPQGRGILEELQADGVDTSSVVVSEEGYPPMIPSDLSQTSLSSALDGARMLYLDGRIHETALLVAQEAARKNVPILVEGERIREGLDDLLKLADYAICSAKFPQASMDKAASIPSALVSILVRLPKIKFVIVTLGEDGCLMLERSVDEAPQSEEMDVDILLELLKQRKDDNIAIPTCVSSPVTKLRANGVGTVCGRLFVGTAEKVPPSELQDTTGAGDSFIGAVLYAICSNMPPEKMLPFAAQVAATCCRAVGARTGLPHCTDARLASFLS
ncbi:ribokinase [Prunus yedoensis var. nudiflora]|uniref:Ribokinase n=1 Tax=Prunus yedoensis var. nudiflora TaxID=2094558 RepID=A0A315B101_PRUYE|nr:ribokinase [Prunus yedoensis var. nudiflora]